MAAVTGFGIGSLLTPALSLQFDMRLAVAAVSIPHVIGTGLRLWLVYGDVNRRVLVSFGLASAAGGLAGAALNAWASNRWLTIVMGLLLLLAATSEAVGLARRLHLRGWVAWVAGALSGLLGGLVGNQGGIRSAALLAFDLPKRQFIATATAIALFVDGARVPVYVATQHDELRALGMLITIASVGVVFGTLVGSSALRRIPEIWFRRVLVLVLAMLGIAMLVRGVRG